MYQHARNTTTQVQHSQQCKYHVTTCQEYNHTGTTQLAVYISCTNMPGIHRYNIASSVHIMYLHAINNTGTALSAVYNYDMYMHVRNTTTQVHNSQQCTYHVPTRQGIKHRYVIAISVHIMNQHARNKTQVRNSQQCTYHVPTCQKYNCTLYNINKILKLYSLNLVFITTLCVELVGSGQWCISTNRSGD